MSNSSRCLSLIRDHDPRGAERDAASKIAARMHPVLERRGKGPASGDVGGHGEQSTQATAAGPPKAASLLRRVARTECEGAGEHAETIAKACPAGIRSWNRSLGGGLWKGLLWH